MRVITRLNIGGPAIHVLLLTRGMRRFGYQTLLVSGHCEKHEGDMSYLVQTGDPVVWLPKVSRSISPWKDLSGLWYLYRLMRKERPLVVHTHTAKAGALGRLAARLARVPIIVHTFHGNSLSNYFSPALNLAVRSIERLLASLTDCLCVLSKEQASELAQRFQIAPESKIRVIPLGLDLKPFLALPEPDTRGGELIAGWLGRLVPVKGIPLLLSVVEETLRRTQRIRFVLAGDGPERTDVELAMRRFRDRITWLGWQEDVVPVLSSCHVLIQTSRNEGTPVALIEGMAAARPFVSTAVGGVVDMVTKPVIKTTPGCQWFANAVLAEPNPTAFADTLLEFLNQPELIANMGRNARTLSAARYQKGTLCNNLDLLYRELMHQKRLMPSPEGAHKCAS